MDIHIRKVQEEDLASFNKTLNGVAAERKYVASVTGFPLETHRHFLQSNIENNLPQVVALDGTAVVGWCDIIPGFEEGFTHSGRLGMGVKKEYRRRGIGERLMTECIRLAKDRGLERVELGVFADNLPAIQLYLKHGFAVEGRKSRARKLDGEYQDILIMGLLFDHKEFKNATDSTDCTE
jgi:ribosomal protein S18 acetylase RimI-like enzyme